MQVLSRYEKEFGSRNYQFSSGKVDFVVIDAQTLDGMFILLHLWNRELRKIHTTHKHSYFRIYMYGYFFMTNDLCSLFPSDASGFYS